MLGNAGNRQAISLLEKWTGQKLEETSDANRQLAAWQAWFSETFPELPEAKLAVDTEQNNWTYHELLSFLTGPAASQGDASRGAVVFEKALCVKCHAYGDRGERIGPDLTTVSLRFQKKEILESILFPSQVISDQFATHMMVLADGKVISGMTSPVGDGSVIVLDAAGNKTTVQKDEVDSISRSKVSAMPDGLLNKLSIEEVADLFMYLTSPSSSELAKKRQETQTK